VHSVHPLYSVTKPLNQLYLCLLIATLNSCINGYDGSLMGAINSYKQYRSYFGFDETEGTPDTGIVYAIYTIGNLVGSFVAGPATDFRGRKWGMFIGTSIIMVGACVQATCSNLGGFMGGRFVLGFGVAITSTAGPAYVSEMAHPVYRGVCTGVFNTFWYVGGIPGSFVPFATDHIAGSMSWRIPIWLQMVFAGIVFVCSPFLPETPRWLIANDRHEEALDTMARFHGEGSRHSPIVMLEYKEMVEDISVTGSDKRWWDYSVRTSCLNTAGSGLSDDWLSGTLQYPRSPLPHYARPLHGLLRPMERQWPRLLLLSHHASRRRYNEQPHAPPLQRCAKHRVLRWSHFRRNLH
jgi:MFS family permease